MNWKFWKSTPKVTIDVMKEKIPLSTLIRWYCYDLGIDDVNSLVKSFNLMPVSQEGEEYEQDKSQKRMDEIVDLMPYFQMVAEINAKAISTIQLQDVETDDVADIEPELMEGLYRQVSFAALIAAFSAALEIGILNRSYGFLSLHSEEEEKDEQ